jgi:hypothetical protein
MSVENLWRTMSGVAFGAVVRTVLEGLSRGVRSWGSQDDERLQMSCECVECEGRDASRSCACPWWCLCSGSSRETYEEEMSVEKVRVNESIHGSVHTLDEEYGQKGTEPVI